MRVAVVVAVIAIIALVRGKAAEACSCGASEPKLSRATGGQLPPEPTLFLFVPSGQRDHLPKAIVARRDGREVSVDDETVLTSARYDVHRLRIHVATPGPLEVVYSIHLDPATFEIVDGLAPPRAARLLSARYQGFPVRPCSISGFSLEIDGTNPAAYRLSWKDEAGGPHEAYLPPEVRLENDPALGFHELLLGEDGCGTDWIDPAGGTRGIDVEPADRIVFDGAELTRLDFDGSEVVVARGALYLGGLNGDLLAFAPPPTTTPPRPRPASPPPRATTWWPVAVGVGGGAGIGGLGMFLFATSRRRRRGSS